MRLDNVQSIAVRYSAGGIDLDEESTMYPASVARRCSALLLPLIVILAPGLLLGTALIRPASAADGLPWRDKGSPFGMVAALGNRVRSDETGTAVQLMREAGV